MRWWGDVDPGWIFEEAKGSLLFILDMIMYGSFGFLSFHLLEVHTEIFMGRIIRCLDVCFSSPQQRKNWTGMSMGRGDGPRWTEAR